MSTPSPPLSIRAPPLPLSGKKPQPFPWTHQETVHLIQAYQEKWYSLKRGQLKASQWEEVAVTVAARCGYDYHHPAKSSIQCRHKMEKLRRRFREEKRRISLGGGGACNWPYFPLMDSLESGPLPLSAQPLTAVPQTQQDEEEEEEDDVDDDEDNGDDDDHDDDEENFNYRNKSRSINYILHERPAMVNRFAGCEPGYVGGGQKRKREESEEDETMGKRVELGLLAQEIRGFAERMVRMEVKKMEMMKETERWRMEMENKRMEMILDSQQRIVETVAASFRSCRELEMEDDF